jgi:hypothetical protein
MDFLLARLARKALDVLIINKDWRFIAQYSLRLWHQTDIISALVDSSAYWRLVLELWVQSLVDFVAFSDFTGDRTSHDNSLCLFSQRLLLSHELLE